MYYLKRLFEQTIVWGMRPGLVENLTWPIICGFHAFTQIVERPLEKDKELKRIFQYLNVGNRLCRLPTVNWLRSWTGTTTTTRNIDELFSICEFELALHYWNRTFTPCHDHIREWMLAHLGGTLKNGLLTYFNNSWTSRMVPASWKSSWKT